ncbi:SpoIIE family protein phosphatase [Miltoncostaea marina]|uniref:SpoIIE family protein phosphatase n=1 Tax=Miltoncostaea marina TaxID=2843215 RepID=UPI001C3E7850|nr:SpoIIE family protein phosphatase [Miltoncostaea marina]
MTGRAGDEAAALAAPGVPPDPPRSDAASILVVDDQHANRLAMQALLEPLGRRIVLAESGEEALRLLLRERFALILLDVQMPGMDGFETARYIRGRLRTRRIPIIFVTAISGATEHIYDGYAAGAVDYMLKPIDPTILRSKVAVFVELFETNARLQRQAESQGVKESLELAQRAGRSGVWDWDLAAGRAFWSREYAELMGLADDATADGFWLATADPRDRDRVRARFRALLDAGDAWDEEFRIVHPRSGVRWVASRGKLFRGADGAPERFTGIVVDVTERRRDEERLRRLHEATAALSAAVTPDEVLQRVLEHSLSAVGATATWLWLPDADGHLARVASEPDAAPSIDPADAAEDLRHARQALAGSLPVVWGAGARWRAAVPIGAGGVVSGVLVLALDTPAKPDHDDVGFLAALGSLCGQAVDRARLLEDEREARRRTEGLQAATAALAAAVTAREVAEAIAHQALLAFAASSAGVRMISPSTGTLDTAAVAGFPDAAARPLGAAPLDARSPTTDCVRAHEPLFLASAAEVEERYPELAPPPATWRPHGALAAIPLSMEGRVIGVVGLRFEGARAFAPGDRESMAAFGRLAALSAARAQLQERDERRRAHTSLLAEVGLAIDADLGVRERLERLTALLVPRIADACFVRIDRAGDGGDVLAVSPQSPDAVATAGYVGELLARRWPGGTSDGGALIQDIDDDALDAYVADAGIEGRVAARVRRWPAHSVLVAPIGARGRTAGALVLVLRGGRRRYDGADLRLAEDIARRAGLAIDNARLYEAQASAAVTLQQSMLPTLPRIAGVGMAARYIAAAAHTEAGGDWYEAVQVGDGRVLLAVGDVVGHGIDSAAVMGQVRSAMRAHALAGLAPAAALEQLSRFAASVDGAAVSTAACVEIDLHAGRLRYACAGHPPPLLMRGNDGGHAFLDAARGVALGVIERGYEEAEAPFGPGDALVLYTDGLVERRGEVLDQGLDRLAGVAAGGGPATPDELCDRLLAGLVDERSIRDDVAVLVACRDDVAPSPLRLRVAAEAPRLAEVRRAVRGWLADAALPARVREDVLLACGEACANAVEHGYADGGVGAIEVELAIGADRRLSATVRDEGRWRPPSSDTGFRGRGLMIMRAVMDDVEVVADDAAGTTIRMMLDTAAAAGPDAGPATRPGASGGGSATAVAPAPRRAPSPGAARCVVEGDVADERIADVRDRLTRAAADRPDVVADLSGVAYLDSTGVRMLLEVAGALERRGGHLTILAPPGGPARRVLDVCGIDAAAGVTVEG